MNNIKILIKSIKYQFLMFFRIKQAVFFSIAFPVFLFIIFGNIWGFYDDYIPFVLTGVVAMTIASDGLFAVGPVIKEYYSNGLIKYLQKQPFNIIYHFLGLIFSRIISLFVVVLLLCLASVLFFNYYVSFSELINYLLGVFIGLFIFSFLGLIFSFSSIKSTSEKGLVNLIYFVFLFTSSAFYPIKKFNKAIGEFGDYLPFNQILNILRGDKIQLYTLLIWIIIPPCIFYFIFNKIKTNR